MSTVIAVTGGIATGKSTFSGMLSEVLNAPLISSDAVVHELYESQEVQQAVKDRFGPEVFSDGEVDRQILGTRAFRSAVDRAWLEDLLHPRVLERIERWVKENAARAALIVEVPLLYEVDFPLKRDFDVAVACSITVQLERLQKRNQLDPEHARARIASQLSILEKIRRANLVIWNEGSHALLAGQVQLASCRIRQSH